MKLGDLLTATSSGWSLRVGHPVVLAIGLAAIAFVVWRTRRATLQLSPWRSRFALFFGTLAAICALVAASEIELVRPADRMSVVVVLDTSRSIERVPGASDFVSRELRAAEAPMHKDDRLAVVEFAASAALAEPPHAKGEGGARLSPTIGRDATDLESAVRRGVDEVVASGGGRVVLISDGVQNRGDALLAAARARSLGVPIDTVTLTQRNDPDVRVVAARGPTLADEGETFEIRAVVHTPLRDGKHGPIDAEVTLKRDGEVLMTTTTKLAAGEDVLRFKDRAPTPGLHRYDVHVRPLDASLDASAEDNEATTFVRVRGPSTVLVLQRDPKRAEPLARALEADGHRVVVRDARSVPYTLTELAAFDLIVLADVPAKELVPSQMEAISTYVHELGGGLLLLGSDGSFGPGGYSQTPIEDLSPVNFDLTRERKRLPLTELIVIDYSGSMGARVDGTHNKLDLANEAAVRAATMLGESDRLGVWHVDTIIAQTIPIGPVGDHAVVSKRIRDVGVGGGGIFIDLSLEAGYKALAKEHEGLRHLLLFADGADAEQREQAPVLVRRAASLGITTSVISLGEGVDTEALAQMAKIGGGRFYLITDARKLPAVFAQETILAARSSVREEDFSPKPRGASPALKGIDLASAPPLHGYVVTQLKPRALRILDAIDGEPLLASWPVGLGNVAAWTSDFTDVWAADFTKWGASSQLFAQLARAIERKTDDARVRLETSASDGTLHVRAEPSGVGDVGAGGLMHLRAHLQSPDGSGRDVELLPRAGGDYATDVNVDAPGAYLVQLLDVGAEGLDRTPIGLSAAMLSRADEGRPTGSDAAMMARLAELSGGIATDRIADVFQRRSGLRPTPLPLAPYALPLAIATMILGVASRRLGAPKLRRVVDPDAAVAPRARPHAHAASPYRASTYPASPYPASPEAQKTSAAPIAASPTIARAPADDAPSTGVAAALAARKNKAIARAEKSSEATAVIVATAPRGRVEAASGSSSIAELAKKKRERQDAGKKDGDA
jgi:uncharacterized membrane protein